MKNSQLIHKVIENHKTPVYVYFEEKLKKNIQKLKESFNAHGYSILYALKANSNPTLLKIMHKAGLGIDACSTEEIVLSLKCGFNPGNIYYNSDCITLDEMRFSHSQGVHIIIGSLDALAVYCTYFKQSKISLRINTGIGAGHSSKVITNGEMSKFGILPSEIEKAKQLCLKNNIEIEGLHSHTGSGDMSSEKYLENARSLIQLSNNFTTILFLNFGGGFGYDYHHNNDYDIRSVRLGLDKMRQNLNVNASIRFVVEPGRYLVADIATLVAKVCSVKDYGSRKYIGLDTGYNHFPRCFYYNAWHEIENITSTQEKTESYDITGYLCQSGDIFCRERCLPRTYVDDIICINDVGAYGYSMSSNFNLRTKPAEVMIDEKQNIHLIRRKETIDDLLTTCLFE
ncbi:diaminopimelate decarboxylase [Prodigiosinella confusarubida]|uniref:Diaminopimelate decarboxylase n=1 Tax=Serratia sp. (strain ATCC 39006) TaxID=104623 RepID=A0A2I5TMF2_SERS3|nr:diaminopimelate decarboxylase [Serratia sp. ATCC 39006]AUH01414.1 diaminopimelate decarboxylase [Serratia sp. ATCC 39006]AUH05735.1 diaminopimelate decarboxylase [Serratia sp. ATCC 39006]